MALGGLGAGPGPGMPGVRGPLPGCARCRIRGDHPGRDHGQGAGRAGPPTAPCTPQTESLSRDTRTFPACGPGPGARAPSFWMAVLTDLKNRGGSPRNGTGMPCGATSSPSKPRWTPRGRRRSPSWSVFLRKLWPRTRADSRAAAGHPRRRSQPGCVPGGFPAELAGRVDHEPRHRRPQRVKEPLAAGLTVTLRLSSPYPRNRRRPGLDPPGGGQGRGRPRLPRCGRSRAALGAACRPYSNYDANSTEPERNW